MTHFVVNVQILLVKRDDILLIVRSDNEAHAAGVTDLPGGKVELSEMGAAAVETCARRELHEETGITYNGDFTYVTSALFVADDGIPVVNIVMRGELDPGDRQKLVVGTDEKEGFWIPIEQLDRSVMLPTWTRGYIDRGFARARS